MWNRTALLTEGLPARRPNVEPGRAFMQADKPDVDKLHREIGTKQDVMKRRSAGARRLIQQIQDGPKTSKRSKRPLRTLYDRLGASVQRHAGRIAQSLRYKDVPEVPAYQTPENPPEHHSFANVGTENIGTRRAHTKAKDEAKHLSKVLHFMRRSGKALGGSHNAKADHGHGIFEMHFGHDAHRARAYSDHLRRELPLTVANSVRHERGGHAGSYTHRIAVDHDALHRAILSHRAGVEEMVRSPLLGLLSSSA